MLLRAPYWILGIILSSFLLDSCYFLLPPKTIIGKLHCLQNSEMIAKMFWEILDVYDIKSYYRLLSLKNVEMAKLLISFLAFLLDRPDAYDHVLMNRLHGHGMVQSV